ncbi:MAG: hypothetical protein OK452_06320 [Thaumarchaeota archaeon]|nr:hypothetical protein [Nitrososphaerota archaeon]
MNFLVPKSLGLTDPNCRVAEVFSCLNVLTLAGTMVAEETLADARRTNDSTAMTARKNPRETKRAGPMTIAIIVVTAVAER